MLKALGRRILMDPALGEVLCDPAWPDSPVKRQPKRVENILTAFRDLLESLARPLLANPAPFKLEIKGEFSPGEFFAQTSGWDDSDIYEAARISGLFVRCLFGQSRPPNGSPGAHVLILATEIRSPMAMLIDEQGRPLEGGKILDREVRKNFRGRTTMPDRCDFCDRMGKETGCPKGNLKRCGRCKVAMYCSPECSKSDWKEGKHKLACFDVAKG